jgi:hypothetical protein
MRAKVKEKRQVPKGKLLVVFDLLGERFDYRAGQYFWVELLDPPYQDGKGPRCHISAVTSPTERGVIGLCTRVRDSPGHGLAEIHRGPTPGSRQERLVPLADLPVADDAVQHTFKGPDAG